MAALAKSYEQLGFRVIEGGKSGNVAILTTNGFCEIFGERHDNLLTRIHRYQARLPLNFRAIFAEHCRLSTYSASRGEPKRDCYELTKEAFAVFAGPHDDTLQFLLGLAFGALERDDYTRDGIFQQINRRLRELRSGKTGQNELAFEAPIEDDDDLDDAEARAIWHTRVTQEPMPRWLPQTWEETEAGTAYDVILRWNPDDSSYLLRIVRANAPAPIMARIPVADSHTSLLCLEEGNTPLAVIKRALMRLPEGRMTEVGMATVDHFFED